MLTIPNDKLNQALEKASAMGLCLSGDRIESAPTDKIIRCGTSTHPKGKNGAYMVKYDPQNEFITLVLWNHETQERTNHHINLKSPDPTHKPMTPEQRRELQQRIDAKQRADREKLERERRQKADYYVAEFNQLGFCVEHDYLTRKGINNPQWFNFRHDGRFNRDLLCIPFMNNGGYLQGYQTIAVDGTKRFNGAIGGCYWQFPAVNPCPEAFDNNNSFYIIGEGVATVLSAWQAITDYYDTQVYLPYALVAFNAGNLGKAIENTRHNNLPYLLLVDNDSSKPKNAGVDTARQLITANPTAKIYPLIMPDCNDTNDFIIKHGTLAFIQLFKQLSPITQLIGH